MRLRLGRSQLGLQVQFLSWTRFMIISPKGGFPEADAVLLAQSNFEPCHMLLHAVDTRLPSHANISFRFQKEDVPGRLNRAAPPELLCPDCGWAGGWPQAATSERGVRSHACAVKGRGGKRNSQLNKFRELTRFLVNSLELLS